MIEQASVALEGAYRELRLIGHSPHTHTILLGSLDISYCPVKSPSLREVAFYQGSQVALGVNDLKLKIPIHIATLSQVQSEVYTIDGKKAKAKWVDKNRSAMYEVYLELDLRR